MEKKILFLFAFMLLTLNVLAEMLFVVEEENGMCGVVDEKGNYFKHYKNAEIYPYDLKQEDILLRGTEYVDKTGRKKINIIFEYDLCKPFSEGMASIRVNNKWGYINKLGEIVIKPQFDEARTFDEEVAAVKIGNKWGYINKSGEVIIKPKFDEAWYFSEGMAIVGLNDKWMFIDKEGRTSENYVFSYMVDKAFSEGMSITEKDNKIGFIDKTLKIVITPKFDGASFFSNGLAAVKIGKKMGYINRHGNIVIKPNYNIAMEFINEMAVVEKDRKGKWGYIDKAGKIIIDASFEYAFPFVCDIAPVVIEQGIGFINKKGNFLIETKFKRVQFMYKKLIYTY